MKNFFSGKWGTRLLAGSLLLAGMAVTRFAREVQGTPDLNAFQQNGALRVVWVERPDSPLWTAIGLSFGVVGILAFTSTLPAPGADGEVFGSMHGSQTPTGNFAAERFAPASAFTEPADTFTAETDLSEEWAAEDQQAEAAEVKRRNINIIKVIVDGILGRMGAPNHILFASRTQAGKTSTVLGIMDGLNQATKNAAQYLIIDPKNSYFGGYEDKPGVVIRLKLDSADAFDLQSEGLKMLAALERVVSVITKRGEAAQAAAASGNSYNPAPFVVFIDEYPTIKRMLELCDKQMAKDQKVWLKIDALVNQILLMALERKVFLFISGQSHQSNVMGISLGAKDNFAIVAQGRAADFQSVERAVGDSNVIKDQTIRLRLLEQLVEFKEEDQALADRQAADPDNEEFAIPVLYCNIGGHRVARSVDLSHIKTKRLYTPPTAPPEDLPLAA